MKRKKGRGERKRSEKDMSEKLMMFDRLPDHCLACEGDFDKKNKEMVQTWNVVVREDEQTVRLYCPECWQTAQTVVGEYFKGKKK